MAAVAGETERRRVDALLVERGWFETRARAQAAIEAGLVRCNGEIVTKSSQKLPADAPLTAEEPFAWVSRAGVKLAAALDAFGVEPAGRICLDVGASTGGFTEVLLARGAAGVTAVDVGRGQLHPRIAADPRVRSLEGRDARTLTKDDLDPAPHLIVCDASFIGLAKVLAIPLRLAAPEAELVALVKPQFEAGPAGVGRGGIAIDPEAAAAEARAGLEGLEGFRVLAMVDSPIRGGDGNREFLLHARRPA